MTHATALVLTFNGERLLARTLQSLSVCDQLLVVDSGSTDQTLEIARSFGARILHRDWTGFIDQHRFGLDQVDTEWVVTLDQDEYLSPELQGSVADALASPGDVQGFYCSRRSFYFDRFIRHSGWYPDYLLRVFCKEHVVLGGTPPHEEYSTPGPTRRLSGDIIHHPYRDLAEHLAKINAYTQTAAEALHARGKRSGFATALGHGVAKFLKQYVLKAGFLDGRAGLLLALHAFFYSLHKYVRVVEIETQKQTHGPQLPSGRKP
ncbi:MAG: glycosyltransferase family 2 protein [Desulfovibrionales bacterium]